METDPLVGAKLGPCRLEALVGRGGMGRVYRARHLALDRVVAVKLVDLPGAEKAATRQTVLAEARIAAKIDDPRIVAVYEVGEDKGIPYIIMQWVEGEGLDARVRRAGPLPPPEALMIVRETAAALRAAHAAGLVHRDVKPANILIDGRGAVKLADFGIARPAHAAVKGGKGADESISGSFHYMAPEQAYGAPPDPRSDLYALGATWYFALTGQYLYPGSALDALLRHREEPPPDVRRLRPEVTAKAAALMLRLLAKAPEKRPPNAETVLREMSEAGMLLDTESSGSPLRLLPPPPPQLPKPSAEPIPAATWQAELARSAAPIPPSAPPAEDSTRLGSRGAFVLLLLLMGLTGVGWAWRQAVAEDWLAGTFVFAWLPLFLTFGDRRGLERKAFAAAAVLSALGCFAVYTRARAGAGPSLEALIAAGLGAVGAGGAVYLGLWGTDREEVSWSRPLSLLSAGLLVAGAMTWAAPESSGWMRALSAEGARAGAVLVGSGALWRWGGLVVLLAALAATRRLRTVAGTADAHRRNWNR